MELTEGQKLTISGDIISECGFLIFNKGDKVTIREVRRTPAHYGKMSGVWYKETIDGVLLEEHEGFWRLSAFEETQNL